MKKIKRVDYPIKLAVIIGKYERTAFHGVCEMIFYPKGEAPFSKVLEQNMKLLDIDFLINNDLDIEVILNNMIVPEHLTDTDMTVTVVLEILTDEYNKNL